MKNVKDMIADILLDVEFLSQNLRIKDCSNIMTPQSIYRFKESGAYFLGDWLTALMSDHVPETGSMTQKVQPSPQITKEVMSLGLSILELNGVKPEKVKRLRELEATKDLIFEETLQGVLFGEILDEKLKEFLIRMTHSEVNLRPTFDELSAHTSIRRRNRISRERQATDISFEQRGFTADELNSLIKEAMLTWINMKTRVRKDTANNGTTALDSNNLWMEEIRNLILISDSAKTFQVPSLNRKFIGRKAELDEIQKLLSFSNEKINCIAITGMSGFGKTHFVLEYLRSHQKSYSDIIWFKADYSPMIYHQILLYLQRVSENQKLLHPQEEGEEEKKEKEANPKANTNYERNGIENFYQSFSSDSLAKKKKICIVLDNVQNMEGILKYMPPPSVVLGRSLDILITSSSEKWEGLTNKVINLRKFSPEEVHEALNSKMPRNTELLEHVNKFADLIDGVPFVANQAIAYLKQANLTLANFTTYLEKFLNTYDTQSSLELLEERKMDTLPKEKETKILQPELNQSLQAVKKLSKPSFSSIIFNLINFCEMNKCAGSILGVLAYLSPENVTKTFLHDCWLHCTKNIQGFLQVNDQKESYQEQFEKSLELLEAHSFVSIEDRYDLSKLTKRTKYEARITNFEGVDLTEKFVRIYTLTQPLMRLIHHRNGLFEKIYKCLFDWVLKQLAYDKKKLETGQRASWIVPHGLLLNSMKSEIGDLKYMELLYKIGCFQLDFTGEYEDALSKLESTYKFSVNRFGSDHVQTALILDNLGRVWGALGNDEKEKELLTQALQIKEKSYGKDHTQTAITLDYLGVAWIMLGDDQKGRDLLSRALEIKEKHYEKEHAQIASTLHRLGGAWISLGESEKGISLLARAQEIKEKHYGKDHPETAITLDYLGVAWGTLENYEKDKDLLTRALEINEKHYGKDHPQTALTLDNLGVAWGQLGNHEEAKNLLTRALEIKEKHYGKDHPQTSITLGKLGIAWGDLGSHEKKKDLLTRALEINEKHYGEDHPQTAHTLDYLGVAWGQLGNYEEAKNLLTRALKIFEKHYGEDHLRIAFTLVNLGNVWGQLGNHEKKKDLLTRALEINEKHYGKGHPRTALILFNLGVAWGQLGNHEEAKNLLTRALKIFEKHYGEDHPHIAITLVNLGNAWGKLGDREKKKALLTRAQKIKEKHY